jgi:hypothetical protein
MNRGDPSGDGAPMLLFYFYRNVVAMVRNGPAKTALSSATQEA